jgi:curved DNA-binding protein CbpA
MKGPTLEPDNPYRVLGISRNATEEDIRTAYFARVREHPPEKDAEGFRRIRSAYERLKSGSARLEADVFSIVDDEADIPAEAAAPLVELFPIPDPLPVAKRAVGAWLLDEIEREWPMAREEASDS